ncbi:MAG: hypothetical protein ABIP48_00910 [Planctomycetota bacterium]
MTLPKADRDSLLDSLKQAFDDAIESERKRVDRQISLLEKIAEGHDLGAIEDNVLNALGEKAVDDLEIFTQG